MNLERPAHFEIDANYAWFRPVGDIPLADAIDLVGKALGFAAAQGATRILVVTTGWKGIGVPSLADRYFMVENFVSVGAASLKIAMVVSPEVIDPEKFGITVARNRGLKANVFTDEDDARAWLLAGSPGDPGNEGPAPPVA